MNVDAPPQDVKAEKKGKKKELTLEDIEEPIMDWKNYFYPANVTKLMSGKLLIFSIVVGLYYLLQFIACCAAVNFYSDASRLAPCQDLDDPSAAPVVGEQASAIMDPAILLLGIYHIIEWIRCTIMLTVICLNVNLMQTWYVLGLNSLFGLIAFIYCHVVYLGAAAKGCQVNQPTRY